MALPIYPFRTIIYAKAIYYFGTNHLTARDGCPGVADGYYIPVQQYAAKTYTTEQIKQALDNGWINQQEYDETMAYKTT